MLNVEMGFAVISTWISVLL